MKMFLKIFSLGYFSVDGGVSQVILCKNVFKYTSKRLFFSSCGAAPDDASGSSVPYGAQNTTLKTMSKLSVFNTKRKETLISVQKKTAVSCQFDFLLK